MLSFENRLSIRNTNLTDLNLKTKYGLVEISDT